MYTVYQIGILVISSASLSVNIASISARVTDLSPSPSVGLCVGLSVGQSVRKYTVAKRLNGSGCHLGWLVGSVEGWMY